MIIIFCFQQIPSMSVWTETTKSSSSIIFTKAPDLEIDKLRVWVYYQLIALTMSKAKNEYE